MEFMTLLWAYIFGETALFYIFLMMFGAGLTLAVAGLVGDFLGGILDGLGETVGGAFDTIEAVITTTEAAADSIDELGEGFSFRGYGTFTMGMFLTVFGGVGMWLSLEYPYMKGFHVSILAFAIAALMAILAFRAAMRVFGSGPDTTVKLEDLIGKKAVVTSAIEPNDIGEIQLRFRGVRSLLASSEKALSKGAKVEIIGVSGNNLQVKSL
jgi:membrane protein implicated in regulation of membrane protease activity